MTLAELCREQDRAARLLAEVVAQTHLPKLDELEMDLIANDNHVEIILRDIFNYVTGVRGDQSIRYKFYSHWITHRTDEGARKLIEAWLYVCVRQTVLHELAECFQVDGRRPYCPHPHSATQTDVVADPLWYLFHQIAAWTP